MAPKAKDENEETPLEGGLPNPSFGEEESASLPGDSDVMQQVANLEKRLNDFDRRWQSDKDRRIPQIEQQLDSVRKDVGSVLSDYRKLIEGGTNPDVAEWLVGRLAGRVDEIEENRPQTPSPSSGNEVQDDVTTEALGKLEKYGLSANDPAFIKLLRGRYSNTDTFRATVYQYILERAVPGNDTSLSRAGASSGAAIEENEPTPKNPIRDIEDANELYDMAFQTARSKRRVR